MRRAETIFVFVFMFSCGSCQTDEAIGAPEPPVVNCNCGYGDSSRIRSGDKSAMIGRPGKSGAKGCKGNKGIKGEPGSNEVILQELQNMQREIAILREDLKWFTATNGYQYRVTSTLQNWQDSRNICLDMGADLAVVGPKDYEKRLEISGALLKPRDIQYTWIGLSDIAEEGDWVWVDGSAVTAENALWNRGQPDNNGNNQDCGAIWKESYGYRSDDGRCSYIAHALCERLLEQS
ncbi:unnamed protein product [Clavelina lepadiformis]|uniref:C-type lectin domain-containing protein n=1 Tax=Clavelina lepadiformis TaxID=159417 RepID=A0ABP0FP55_CLALP